MKYNPACVEPRCYLVMDKDHTSEQEKTLQQLQAYIESENQRLEKDMGRFSDREVVVRVEYKYCPNLTIIDTPGLISAAPSVTHTALQVRQNSFLVSFSPPLHASLPPPPQEQARIVEALVLAKMKQQEFVILCLEDSSDWSNATTRRIVMKVDPDLSRTILVSTKLDTRIPQFSRAADVEMFLNPPLPDISASRLATRPFFTSVPSGRVGSGSDAVFMTDDDFRDKVPLPDISASRLATRPFFTSVPSGRVGSGSDAVFMTDDDFRDPASAVLGADAAATVGSPLSSSHLFLVFPCPLLDADAVATVTSPFPLPLFTSLHPFPPLTSSLPSRLPHSHSSFAYPTLSSSRCFSNDAINVNPPLFLPFPLVFPHRYLESVPYIVPLLDKEYKSVSTKLSATSAELQNLSDGELKEKSRNFRDNFVRKLTVLLRGSIAAPPDKFALGYLSVSPSFLESVWPWLIHTNNLLSAPPLSTSCRCCSPGETLQEERARGGIFVGSDGQQFPQRHMPNASMRLFGGAQYHRAMAEFRFVVGAVRCPAISREEIVNACGVEDVHDGTNYFRTACVIAVAKAWDVFEPFLRQLGFRLSHIVGRLLPIVLFLLKRDNEPMLVHETFIERVQESYHKFVDATERSCIEKCMEDLTSTTRFVTWSLHNRSRSALRSFFDSAMPNHDSSLLAAVGAFEASTPMPVPAATSRQNSPPFGPTDYQSSPSDDGRGDRGAVGGTGRTSSTGATAGGTTSGGAGSGAAAGACSAGGASGAAGGAAGGSGTGGRLADLLESTLWTRRLAPSSEDIVNALVMQIFEGIRDHFVMAAELKFNCFFLMPLMDRFPARLREDLEAVAGGGLDAVFDISRVRGQLERSRGELDEELRRVHALQAKFASIHHSLSVMPSHAMSAPTGSLFSSHSGASSFSSFASSDAANPSSRHFADSLSSMLDAQSLGTPGPRKALDSGRRLYSPREWEELQRLFVSLAAQSRSNGRHIIASVFQAYYGIHGSLGARLFEIATQRNKDGLMRFQEFASIKAVFDKGSPDEIDRMCFQVMDVLKSGKVDRREVEEVMRSALATVFGPQHSPSPALIQAFISSAFPSNSNSSSRPSLNHLSPASSALASTALHPSSSLSSAAATPLGASAATAAAASEGTGGRELTDRKEAGRPEQEGQGVGRDGSAGASVVADPRPVDDDTSVAADDGRELSYQDAVRWWNTVPAVKKFLRSLLTPPDLRPPLPTLVVPAVTTSARHISSEAGQEQQDSREDTWLLQKELTWHIAGALQDKECHEWCLLYSSKLHGLSFNSFLGKVSSVPHPTVLVVRDSAGAIFGAFASKPWERGSAFFGDMRSLLFSFLPTAAVFKAAGTSTNIQWCASGFASESIPNGIGLGGQPGHFGLFLSSDFDSGHSRPSTTFNSPSLSSTPNFTVDAVECWAVISASLSDRIFAGDGGLGVVGLSGAGVGSGRSDHAGSGRGTVLDRVYTIGKPCVMAFTRPLQFMLLSLILSALYSPCALGFFNRHRVVIPPAHRQHARFRDLRIGRSKLPLSPFESQGETLTSEIHLKTVNDGEVFPADRAALLDVKKRIEAEARAKRTYGSFLHRMSILGADPEKEYYRFSNRSETMKENDYQIYYYGGAVLTQPINLYIVYYGTWYQSEVNIVENFIKSISSTSYTSVSAA
ncbi:unnamed protein product [Closterium sp. Yama58-4]|nr:unnamed protein product [Closterium sp. Yama58-4]